MSEGQRGAVLQRLCALIGTQAGGDQTDGQLLERYAVHRESAAFAALVHRHGPMVFGLCRRVLRDHHQAEDAFQATFLVLVRKAPSLDRRRPLGNWLYTIAYHAALKTRAATARRARRESRVARADAVEPRDEASSAELRQLLDAELSRLPEKYRAPVVLCYLQGRTNEQAAAELGWPSGTVKGRLARARDLLRDRLAGRGLALTLPVLAEPASLPPGLVERTAEAASAFADKILAAHPAVAIAQGVLKAMWMTKLKTAAALVLAAVVVATGLGFWMLRVTADPAAAPVPADKPKDDDAPAKLPDPKGQHLALDPVRSTDVQNDKVERPAVTLGWFQAKDTDALHLSTAFLEGRLEIIGPKAGQPVSMMVITPDLNSGEDATLEMLTRDGNVFTLVLNVWQDDADRTKNIIHRKLFINIPLGTLEAGKYEFGLVRRTMLKETAKASPWYEYKSATAATVSFKVSKEDDNDIGKPALLKYDELRAPKEKPQGVGTFYQLPKPQWHPLGSGDKDRKPPQPGLRVGTFDLDKWTESKPKTLDNLPELREPAAGDAVYATVLSPSLNSMEWMSLRAIEWKEKEVILHVDLWQDSGPRFANVISMHHLVIPLQTPGKSVDGKWQTAPGDYRVKVKWTFLRAPNYPTPGQPYTPQDPDKLGDKDVFKQLIENSAAKFTIK